MGKRKKGGQTRQRHSRSEEPAARAARELPDAGQQSVGSLGGQEEWALGDPSPRGSKPCLLFLACIEGEIFHHSVGCPAVTHRSQESAGSPQGFGLLAGTAESIT